MRVCVVGIGLIGGSLIKALKQTDFCTHLSAVDVNEQARTMALREGLVDEACASSKDLSTRPDLIVLAVAVGQYRSVLMVLRDWLREGTIVTDVGSTKMSVIEDARSVFDDEIPPTFLPGHPIAGRECSGLSAAQADLFQQRKVILTPLPSTDQKSIQLVTRMWSVTGAIVEQMDPAHHDEILALTSHLPHALAFALVRCLANNSERAEIFRYAAGGFADFTRIASSNPQLWRDICLANKNELMNAMDQFVDELRILQIALQNNDATTLEAHFSDAKQARDQFCVSKACHDKE